MTPVYATTRDELYSSFGPMLIEAICRVVRSEINLIRGQLGLPLRTNQQIINTIEQELKTLNKYNWMD